MIAMPPHPVDDTLGGEVGGGGGARGFPDSRTHRNLLLRAGESRGIGGNLRDEKRRGRKKLSAENGEDDRGTSSQKADPARSGSVGEVVQECKKNRSENANDSQASVCSLPETDEVAREELISHVENPFQTPYALPADTSKEQFRRNLRNVRAIVPLVRGFEKIKKDVVNIMWRDRSTPLYEKENSRKVGLWRVEDEINAAAARFQAGLAGRRSHTWQCELLKYNNMTCKDPDSCWRRKFGEKVLKARDSNDWSDFLLEYETNVIFILSKWSVFLKYGSKAFSTHCLEIIKQFIRDHWPHVNIAQMCESQRSRFRAQIRDEVSFCCGVTVVEVQDYILRFLRDLDRSHRDEKEEHSNWETFLEKYEYKYPRVWLSEDEKEYIRQQTLNNPFQPYFTKNERNKWTGRTGIAWKHAEKFQNIFLYQLEKLPKNVDHSFFKERGEKRIKMARDEHILPHVPLEVIEEILLPREEVIDKEREDAIDRTLASSGMHTVAGEGLPAGRPLLRGA